MKFEIIQCGKNDWRFCIVAGNGKILAQSDSYTRKRNAVEAVALIKAGAPFARTVEVE